MCDECEAVLLMQQLQQQCSDSSQFITVHDNCSHVTTWKI